jgi:hypothetical protein
MKKLWFVLAAIVAVGVAVSPASARQTELSPARFAAIADGVALVVTYNCSGQPMDEGTGFLVGKQLLMTARHVVGSKPCKVRALLDGQWYTASLFHFWYVPHTSLKQSDMATMRLDRPARGYVFSVSSGVPPIGATVAMIGHPLGNPVSLAQGPLIQKQVVRGLPTLGVRLATAEGASGSPLLNRFGDVIGILQQGFVQPDNGAVFGINLARTWGKQAERDLCKQYPFAGVPGCHPTSPNPPLSPPSNPPPPSSPSPSAPPPSIVPGHYCGGDSLGDSFCFDVTADSRQIENLTFTAAVTCTDNSKWTWTVAAPVPVAIESDGSFNFWGGGLHPDASFANFTGFAPNFTGNFDSRSNAFGGIIIEGMSWDRDGKHYTCSGKDTGWTASRV